MLHQIKISATALLLALAIVPSIPKLASALTNAETMDIPLGPSTYGLSHDSVISGQAFSLTLTNKYWRGDEVFSRESVTVVDKRIHLSYVEGLVKVVQPIEVFPMPLNSVVASTSLKKSVPVILPVQNKVTFNIPALSPGRYEVWATEIPACVLQGCKIYYGEAYAGQLEVTSAGGITYSFNPAQITAGNDFTLDLLSYQFNCGTTYEMVSSSVSGNTLSLNFLDRDTPAAICPAIYQAYGPAFKIKGLKAGNYNVVVHRLPPCILQKCLVAPLGMSAGNLLVTDPVIPKEGWYLAEKKVSLSSGKYPLQVLNNKYGNCQTSFSNMSASISSGNIYLNFSVDNHPENICIMDQRPYGPTFQLVSPMKAGAYPIFVHEIQPCELTTPRCLAMILPKAIDTLYIISTLPILASQNQSYLGDRPRATIQGNRIQIDLVRNSLDGNGASTTKATSGFWKIDLMTLSGQILVSEKVKVNESHSGTISLETRLNDRKGIYVLRMTAPNGKIQSLPIVDKD